MSRAWLESDISVSIYSLQDFVWTVCDHKVYRFIVGYLTKQDGAILLLRITHCVLQEKFWIFVILLVYPI